MSRSLLAIVLFCTMSVDTEAQTVSTDSVVSDTVVLSEKKSGLGKRLNNKLKKRYFHTKYDTNYVARPKQKWLLRLLGNQTGNSIYNNDDIKINQNKWLARAFLGVRL